MSFTNQTLLLLRSQLDRFTKSDLIDLLLLSENEQKSDELRNISTQITNLKTSDSGCNRNRKKTKTEDLVDEELPQVTNVVPQENENNYSLDNFVGVYMAYSMFHGYLNLVIPNQGTKEKNLKELMQVYEATEHIKFVVYKLFLLIPQSAYCPTTLESVSTRIGKSKSLKEKTLTRAGVQDRSYKSSVYKIHNDDTVTYVVAEYATPVQTYKEVMTYNYGAQSEAYKRNKDKVLQKFYETLQNILAEHEDCTDYCELIFYKDKDAMRTRDVADILMERTESLKNQTK